HLAVADPAAACGADDDLDDVGRVGVAHEHLEAHLGHEVDRVLRAAVDLRVAALLPVAARLDHGHAADAELLERCPHLAEAVGLDDRRDQPAHRATSSTSAETVPAGTVPAGTVAGATTGDAVAALRAPPSGVS